ncbi:MAG: 50S ribosomal protein L3 [bacterium]
MIGLIGKKISMTNIFENNNMIPVTVIEVLPNKIVQKKTPGKEGYLSIQLGYGFVKSKRVTKPRMGHFKKVNQEPTRILKEFKIEENDEFNVGDEIKVDIFEEKEKVDISGISKGKGFAGVVKRYGFRGGRATRGSMFHRAPGSSGSSSDPSRVFKGKRFPGRMGGKKVSVQNLTVQKIKLEKNLLIIKGGIPGANGQYVVISKRVKNTK